MQVKRYLAIWLLPFQLGCIGLFGSRGDSSSLDTSSLGLLIGLNMAPSTPSSPDSLYLEVNGTRVSSGSTQSFGSLQAFLFSSATIYTLRNPTREDISFSGADLALTGDAADFFFWMPAPFTSIPAGSARQFRGQFRPQSVGAKTATLNPAGITLNVTGTGTGVPVPEIKVYCGTEISNAGSCSFGNIQTSNSSAKTVWVYNVGIGSMTLSSLPTLSGADAGQFSLNTTGINNTIAFNDGTSFTVTFSPTTTGTKNAVLTIPNDDSDESPFTINLSGTGTAGPSPEINLVRGSTSLASGTTMNMGRRSSGTTSFSETILLQNTGNATLTLTGPPYVSLSGADANQFSLNQTSMTGSVASSGSTWFEVSFAPTSAGIKNATLTIANNDLDESSYTVQLTGTALGAQPVIVVRRSTDTIPAGGSYWFDINPSCVTDISFQIWNYGSSTLNLSGTPRVRLVGVVDNAFAVVSQPSVASIAPNGGTTFTLESCLLPFPSGGFYRDESAVVEIESDDPDVPTFSFTVMSTFLC